MGVLTLFHRDHCPITLTAYSDKVPHPLTFRNSVLQGHGYSRLFKVKINLPLMLKKSLDRGRCWDLPSVPEKSKKKILVLEIRKPPSSGAYYLWGLWNRESGPK